MSLNSWKKEFYPTEAADSRPGKSAVTHSLRKWRGLLPANLKKHDLFHEADQYDISYEDECFTVDAGTCALCFHYINDGYDSPKYDPAAGFCVDCPLNKLLGGRCDVGSRSPFNVWVDTGDPKPMIKALEKAEASFPVRKK